ncbi:HNH endonuclease [Serratia fonticola]|uniref:HNH endonuclease n=1 Tax=Serratia fonticola TaxID=47917 RepID=UPI00217AACE4|nr:HNH endonuclease [Serratia fonticola]CAI1776545.1 Bacteriophage Lambda NinG protein [Serratia fonticola]
MNNYPKKIYNPVVYFGKKLSTYNEFSKRLAIQKKPNYWESEEDQVKDIKSFIKEHYIVEQDYTCCYCKQRIEVEHKGAWDAEHIIPKANHPSFLFEPENLAISCKDCNGSKSNQEVLVQNKTKNRQKFGPVSNSGAYKIVHPHFDIYDAHIEILSRGRLYRGRTSKGIYTVKICELLRFGLDTNYSNVAPGDLGDVANLASALADKDNLDELYYALLELEDEVKRKTKEVYELRAQRRRN